MNLLLCRIASNVQDFWILILQTERDEVLHGGNHDNVERSDCQRRFVNAKRSDRHDDQGHEGGHLRTGGGREEGAVRPGLRTEKRSGLDFTQAREFPNAVSKR